MIPAKIHFIFGLSDDFGRMPFGFIHYMAIKSAIIVNKPDMVFFYYMYEPKSDYFMKIKPYLNMIKIVPPESIFGNPLKHYAHKSDILRLLVLYNFGGVYLDLDTVCNKPFNDILDNSFIIGQEKKAYEDGVDLCNAVLLAEPKSKFIDRWLQVYQTFRSEGRDRYWAEHSVLIPKFLAKYYPTLVKQMPYDSFHYPISTATGLRSLFLDDKQFPQTYCHHLWESKAWPYLVALDEEKIKNNDTTYNRLARRFLDVPIDIKLKFVTDNEKKAICDTIQQSISQYDVSTDLAFLFREYYKNDKLVMEEYYKIKDEYCYYSKCKLCKIFYFFSKVSDTIYRIGFVNTLRKGINKYLHSSRRSNEKRVLE